MLSTSASKNVTLSFTQKDEAPLFAFQHVVFHREALGQVQISVFERTAEASIILGKMSQNTALRLSRFDFRSISLPNLSVGKQVTQEQRPFLLKQVQGTKFFQFPEVEQINYFQETEKDVKISKKTTEHLLNLVQEEMARRFPSIKVTSHRRG